MSTSTSTRSESSTGPGPHEDLTIADHLEMMGVEEKRHPGECCFENESGERRWISDQDLEQFIRHFGAVHPSDYFATHGHDWKVTFFGTL